MQRKTTSLARAMGERMSVDGVTYKIANCRAERDDAFRLIHDVYVKSGLMQPNGAGMRLTPYHLLPTTDLFVAYHGKQLIYTMTLISDDQLGLPMESVYGHEVEQLRRESNSYIAEVSCLASRVGYFDRNRMFNVFVQLASLMVQSARENEIEKLVIACNPRHARFYQNFLGFSKFGDQREYSDVLDKPAIACEHDFSRFEHDSYPLQERIYSTRYRHWELYHQPMLIEEKTYYMEIGKLESDYFPLESVS